MAALYATVADLRLALDGTDAGTGTASQLTDAQLTAALTSASNRVSVYAGTVFDSSTPQAQPPAIFHDLTLDLAAFWATTTYMKHKTIGPEHPVYLKYKDAQQMLTDVRDGKLRLDVQPPGGVGQETGTVINRLPPIFTGDDSNTRLSQLTGTLEPDSLSPTPAGRDGYDLGGPVYQG